MLISVSSKNIQKTIGLRQLKGLYNRTRRKIGKWRNREELDSDVCI